MCCFIMKKNAPTALMMLPWLCLQSARSPAAHDRNRSTTTHGTPDSYSVVRDRLQHVAPFPVKIPRTFFAYMDMHFPPRCLFHALAASMLLLLAGCASSGGSLPSSASDTASQVDDAATQANATTGTLERVLQAVGLAKPKPPAPTEQQLPLRIFTAQNLNAGQSRKALALVVKVYHLRSLDRFKQTPFDDSSTRPRPGRRWATT